MRLAPLSLLAIVVTLCPCVGGGFAACAADSSPAGGAPTSIRDGVVDPIAGIYVSDADPNGSLVLSGTGQGRVLVIAGSLWEAQGWYQDDAFVGAWRRPGLQAQSAASHTYGWIRFRRENDSLVVAQFADSTGAKRIEHWKLVQHFVTTAAVPARSTTATGDSLPHAGESVQVDEYPHPVTTVPPVYPKRARQDGIEGTVVVEVLVGRDGRVHDARILKSIPILDDAAVAAVRQWIFRPAQSKGQPVAVWVAAPVKFTLQ